jgi:NitT/TauT family transport system substrate-binding protein
LAQSGQAATIHGVASAKTFAGGFRPYKERDILANKIGEITMNLGRYARLLPLAALTAFIPWQSRASDFAVSQYGRVTATLPWAVALEKGYFTDAGIKIDHIISGEGGGTTLRNMLASDHIGEIALVANPKGDIHKVRDLQGKKAGFTNPKSTSELLLRLALKEAGMSGKGQVADRTGSVSHSGAFSLEIAVEDRCAAIGLRGNNVRFGL